MRSTMDIVSGVRRGQENFVNVDPVSQVYRRRKILMQKLVQLESMEPTASPTTQATPQNFPSTASGVTATGIDSSPALPKKTVTERKAGLDLPSQSHRKNSLTERRRSVAAKASTNLNKEKSEISSIASAIDKGESLDNSQMEAFSRIIRSEIRSLNEELKLSQESYLRKLGRLDVLADIGLRVGVSATGENQLVVCGREDSSDVWGHLGDDGTFQHSYKDRNSDPLLV